MISNIGEDMCGAMYQWLNEQSYKEPATPGSGVGTPALGRKGHIIMAVQLATLT